MEMHSVLTQLLALILVVPAERLAQMNGLRERHLWTLRNYFRLLTLAILAWGAAVELRVLDLVNVLPQPDLGGFLLYVLLALPAGLSWYWIRVTLELREQITTRRIRDAFSGFSSH